jgi:hypothetical protein
MDIIIEQIIEKKIDSLVNFIIDKHSNANKECIYRKIHQLHILPPKVPGPKRAKAVFGLVQVIDSLRAQDVTTPSVIKVQRSQYSNYVLYPPPHERFDDLVENKFVMNINTQTIIGVENDKGEIEPLNKYLIEICHKYKLRFEMPSNLNAGDEISDGVFDDDEIHELGLSHKEEEEDEENDDNNF